VRQVIKACLQKARIRGWAGSILGCVVSLFFMGTAEIVMGQSLHADCPASSLIKQGTTQGRWRAYIVSDQDIWFENPANGNLKQIDRFQCLMVVNKDGTISSTKCFSPTGFLERKLISGQFSVFNKNNCTFTGDFTLGRVPAASGATEGQVQLKIIHATMSADWLSIFGFGGDGTFTINMMWDETP
jgi:hypothetical protein